jgi:hypothetical protein
MGTSNVQIQGKMRLKDTLELKKGQAGEKLIKYDGASILPIPSLSNIINLLRRNFPGYSPDHPAIE